MNRNNPKYVEARRMMVQGAIDEITNVQNFTKFYQSSFYQIAKFGLQQEAKEEKLFDSDKWAYSYCKNELIEIIRKFLVRHIK